MSPPKPSITSITLASLSNNEMMKSLFAHFNGSSIYFQPVLEGGNPIENGFISGEDSFLIEPVSSNEVWQVNFRRTPNDRGLVMLDPGNGITDSGSLTTFPVGASAQASGEVDYPWSMDSLDSSAKIFILEYSDALMIFVFSKSSSHLSHSCYVGRIHDPFNSNNPSEGLDGLGIFCGKPFLSEASQTEAWASSDTTTQQIRVGFSDWVTSATAWKSTSGFDSFVGARPDGIVLRYLGRPLGVLRYFFNFTGITQAVFSLIWDEKGAAQYMYCSDKAAPSSQVIPWVDGSSLGLASTETVVIPEFLTYSDLPTSASGGDLALVTTTSSIGVYTFVTSIEGYALNLWIPSWIASRITGYMRNSGGDPVRASMGLGGENLATLKARGWNDTTSNGAWSLADSGDDLLFTAGTTNFSTARFQFSDVVINDTLVFILHQINVTAGSNSPSPGFVCVSTIRDGIKRVRTTFNFQNVNNRIAQYETGTDQIGDGTIDAAAFDTVFTTRQIGDLDSAPALASGLIHGYLAKNGYTPGTSDFGSLSKEHPDNTASPYCDLLCQNGTGDTSSFLLREFHIFELGP